MSREVEAYNTYFGDCIILKDKDDDSNLLIDFGTHCLSNFFGAYQKRDELEKKIAEDIYARYKSQNISLLITHFHDDHISGLMYMYNTIAYAIPLHILVIVMLKLDVESVLNSTIERL